MRSAPRFDRSGKSRYNSAMKDLKYLSLFDAYAPLLTEHQREVCELYYMCDLSLTEIAEQKGISKQSVSDTLAKSRAALDEYEDKLHVIGTSQRIARTAEQLAGLANRHPELSREIDEISALLCEGKD